MEKQIEKKRENDMDIGIIERFRGLMANVGLRRFRL